MPRYKVLAAGICSLLLTMGVARFAYTPLLPVMQHEAGLGIAQAGWLAAINYIGYLAGAFAVSFISDLVLKDRLYRVGMIVAVLTTAMMAVTGDGTVWAISRFLAGLSTAAGMLLGTGLILNWLIRHDYRSELGIHFSGIGLGIVGAAALVAVMNRWQLDWRAQWYVFTAAAALLLVPSLGWLPPPDRSTQTRSGHAMQDTPPSAAFLRLFIAAYFCVGVGYVVSATFIVAVVDALPGLHGQGTLVFLVIGLGAAPACILWDLVARWVGDVNALIVAAVIEIGGILLPLGGGLVPALCGAVLFGLTVTGLVSLVLTMAGRYYPTHPATMMGKVTLSLGLAQVVAPAVTGVLAARLGNYHAGLYLAAAVMAAGTLFFALLRTVEAPERPYAAPSRM